MPRDSFIVQNTHLKKQMPDVSKTFFALFKNNPDRPEVYLQPRLHITFF